MVGERNNLAGITFRCKKTHPTLKCKKYPFKVTNPRYNFRKKNIPEKIILMMEGSIKVHQ